MTLLARVAQAAFVLVLMTGCALLRQPEIGAIQVLDLDGRFVRRGNMRRIVALLAAQSGMFAVQGPAGGPMIELRQWRLPADQRKVDAVMFRMTLRASLAGGIMGDKPRMEPATAGNPGSNFRVAIQAPQRRLRANLVTGRAVGRAVEKRMRLRKRSRGYLRLHPNPAKRHYQ